LEGKLHKRKKVLFHKKKLVKLEMTFLNYEMQLEKIPRKIRNSMRPLINLDKWKLKFIILFQNNI
jgi:hypothetical protein